MPTFGSRKRLTEITQPQGAPEPPSVAQSAREQLNSALNEQTAINATLDQHREQRAELLKDGQLGAVHTLASEDAELRLRLEQLALQLPDHERALAQEQREEWERAWQSHRPGLAAAQAELVQAIQTFFTALERANALHGRAQNFGEKLQEFVTPPPPAPVYNDWSLRQYLAVVERRQRPTASSLPMLELAIEAPFNIPPAQRFVPRRVPVAEIEAISPIAPTRAVKILHGPVRTSHLNIGIARMHPGEQHSVSARAAHALVGSGCAEYADEPATVTA